MKRIFVSYIGAALIAACTNNESGFYSEIENYGERRIPLIYPTYAGTTEGIEGPWFFMNSYSTEGFMQVAELDILDSIIVGYDDNAWIQVPEKRDTTWYVSFP